MPTLREQYKIREFQQARQSLDGYYNALNTLARLLRCHAPQAEIDEQGQRIREAKARLGRSVERLGFSVVDIEE
jgi:exonuclease VII large subunit